MAVLLTLAVFLGGGVFFMQNGGQKTGIETPLPAAWVDPLPPDALDGFAGEFSRVFDAAGHGMPDAAFVDADGKSVSFQGFRGRHVLLNLWATWCGPCVVELPSLERLQDLYPPEKLTILAVSLDRTRTREELAVFLENRAIGPFALAHDEKGEVERLLAIRGLPTSFLIAPDGKIRYVFEGDADWSSPLARSFLDTILNQ